MNDENDDDDKRIPGACQRRRRFLRRRVSLIEKYQHLNLDDIQRAVNNTQTWRNEKYFHHLSFPHLLTQKLHPSHLPLSPATVL